MIVDLTYRTAYRAAFRVLKIWWYVRRPDHRGALVAVWHDGKLLLVRQSYRKTYSLPGGTVGRKEAPEAAACRELREEVGLDVQMDELVPIGTWTLRTEYINDTAHIFEFHATNLPEIVIDNREIVDARFVSPNETAALPMGGHLRRYIADWQPQP